MLSAQKQQLLRGRYSEKSGYGWLYKRHQFHCQASVGRSTATVEDSKASTSTSEALRRQGTARFAATKQQSQFVSERQRALADYMALPASQYSVLDARKIERIDDKTFRCYVGGINFLNFSVEPVITVSVTVEERGCTIRLLSCKLQGSQIVEDVNDKFTAQMTNVVRWEPTEDPLQKRIVSNTSIEVLVDVPGWMSLVPVGSIEAAGRQVMQSTLRLMVPRFLEQLKKDYELWASGDDSRKPIGTGEL
jgi:hypothetical protein